MKKYVGHFTTREPGEGVFDLPPEAQVLAVFHNTEMMDRVDWKRTAHGIWILVGVRVGDTFQVTYEMPVPEPPLEWDDDPFNNTSA